MRLGIVIAAFNEEKTIAKTVESAKPYGEVVVIDDGSRDQTAALAEKAGAKVFRQQNKGYDGALNAGFERARELGFTHVITFDADGQHPAEAIPQYIQAFNEGCSLVVGIRPQKQRISENLFALYTKLFFGIDDPLCGMKGYEMSHFQDIKCFDSYHSTGTELMLRYLKKKVKIKQFPIKIYDRLDQPRFGRLIRANFYILRSLVKGIINT